MTEAVTEAVTVTETVTETEDLVYLAVGLNDPHEVCEYPDTGKVMVRSLKRVGLLTKTEYMKASPRPRMLALIEGRLPSSTSST